MAEVILPDHLIRTAPGGPVINMASNPDFAFPIRPRPAASYSSQSDQSTSSNESRRRPASSSMHIDIPNSETHSGHRRTPSTLPSFSFNFADTSGRMDDDTPPRTPDESTTILINRRGHRRGGSEFVGGDSRLGVSNALSSSPSKSTTLPEGGVLPAGVPSGRRGHSHRRSSALSSHDVSKIMQSSELQPRLSSSLPNTPLEHPTMAAPPNVLTTYSEQASDASDPFGPPLVDAAQRPPSRPRVGFSDNVEFIPRPLSTISSETESSMSTVRGHSVNNSISSVLSLSASSPPSTRSPRTLLSTAEEDEADQIAKSSSECGKKVEQEGRWPTRQSNESLKRPMSESAVNHPKTTFIEPDSLTRPRKRALSHALGFDRRRSEPAMRVNLNEPSRLSAISLQEPGSSVYGAQEGEDPRILEHRSSARRIKEWAASKITKRTKEANKAFTASSGTGAAAPTRPQGLAISTPAPMATAPVAETDLDAVFNSQDGVAVTQRPLSPLQPRIETDTPPASHHSTMRSRSTDELDAVVDLDAALGPFKTPPIGSHRPRKELHSSRLTKDFSGPGGHYHRRAESEPMLPPFEVSRESKRPLSEMLDVFEEDEEDSAEVAVVSRSPRISAGPESEAGLSCQIVDLAPPSSSESDERLDLRGSWEPERPPSSHSNSRSMLSFTGFEGRSTSIIEDTILEEASPVGDVEIVSADEEPRASSQTKSSDSSETTILATPLGTLHVPDGQHSLMTPETYQTSTFSSPALRPGSFDGSRLDTAASSIADNRTISSCATGDHFNDLRVSVDVPSLTSSRSTMISSVPGNHSRRDFGNTERMLPVNSSRMVDPTVAEERRRKRGSIQSLSQLVGSPFGAKSRGLSDARPQTAGDSGTAQAPKKKDHRLKRLMFWKSKHHSEPNIQRAS